MVEQRYYSPELCRFIQPDDIEYLDPSSINGLNLYCYCFNNPIMYYDHSGHLIESLFDILSIGYDIYCLFTNDGHKDWKNWAALGLDVVCLILPIATGGSAIVRTAGTIENADDVYDTIKSLNLVDNASDIAVIGRTADRVHDVGNLGGFVTYGGFQHYDDLFVKGVYGWAAAEIIGKSQNALWLSKQLFKGRTIIDIGLGVGRGLSSSYRLELLILEMYKIRRAFRWGVRAYLEF